MTTEITRSEQIDPVRIRTALERVLLRLRSEHSRRAYRSDWDDWLAWCSEQAPFVPFHAAVPRDVLGYVSALASDCAPKTVARRITVLRTIYAELVAEGLMIANPAREIRPPRTDRDPRTPWLDADDMGRFLAPLFMPPADWRGRRNRIVLLVLAGMGLRRSEVASLRIDHFRTRPDGGLTAGPFRLKGGRNNTVAVPKAITPILRDWLGELSNGDGAPLFPSREGGPESIGPETVRLIVKEQARVVGIDPVRVTPHALRRTFATLASLADEDPKTIQSAMGHSQASTTERYIKAAKSMQAAPGETVFRGMVPDGKVPP